MEKAAGEAIGPTAAELTFPVHTPLLLTAGPPPAADIGHNRVAQLTFNRPDESDKP
ncbi:hypothetical protein [Chitinophaga rhizosphaerae]|uniref:hypothetical protein n=1 Tax=Chitinophaga rhizosphaerae TaxID=1864947 RepID=UPI0013E0C94B|nr:hypothetical protein [Chitinophaga rhizosphaerae]